MEIFHKERITDISNDLCKYIKDNDTIDTEDLVRLYDYHKNNNHIYPLTNWQAHRIRCMSCIAARLKDKVKIWHCHYLVLQYFFEKSHCQCHCVDRHPGENHDFHHRDSLNYLVYGSQALANACLYLKPFTKYNYYYDLFEPILDFINPFIRGEKTHIEYVNSEIHSDKTKPEYGKKWNPSYASTFFRILEQIKK
jgi:hypothetical protein